MFVLGSTGGAFIGGVNAEKFGRKKAMVFDGVCMLIGWILIGFSSSFPVILTGRFICGSAAASLQTIIPAYVSEISQPGFRNVTGLLYPSYFIFGGSVMLVLGAILPWELVIKILLACPILYLIGLIFCPESPIWLVTKGKMELAEKELYLLRKCSNSRAMVKLELDRIKKSYDEKYVSESDNEEEEESKAGFLLSLLKDKAFMKPLLTLILTYSVFYEWSGMPPLAFYMVQVFIDLDAPIDPYIATAILYTFRCVVIIFANFFVAHFKMRPVFFSTALCHLIFLGIVTVYSFLDKDGMVSSVYPMAKWTPIICVMLIYATAGAGCFNIMYSFTGVLLPSYARTFGSGIVGVIDNIALVGASKSFPLLLNSIGLHGTFLVNLICVATSILILWFALPETYGLTLEDIEQFYRTNNKTSLDEDSKSQHNPAK